MLNQSLNTLYDKEDRTAERAGDAEERLFNAVFWACKKYPQNEDKITDLFKETQEKINTEMKNTDAKIKRYKTKNKKRDTLLRIESLEKQIKIYYECMGKIDDMN